MESTHYLYRRGDGNEGDFPRFVVALRPGESPYNALAALVENDYIARTRTRNHIRRTLEIAGEAEHGIFATVYEGPKGESAFGSAWITASLEPVREGDQSYWAERVPHHAALREVLDRTAWKRFQALQAEDKAAEVRHLERSAKALGDRVKVLEAQAADALGEVARLREALSDLLAEVVNPIGTPPANPWSRDAVHAASRTLTGDRLGFDSAAWNAARLRAVAQADGFRAEGRLSEYGWMYVSLSPADPRPVAYETESAALAAALKALQEFPRTPGNLQVLRRVADLAQESAT